MEYLAPYGWQAAELAARLRAHGLRQVLFNAPAAGLTPPEMAAAWGKVLVVRRRCRGKKRLFGPVSGLALCRCAGLPVHPCHERHRTYRGRPRRPQATLIDNLRWACAQAAAQGCQLIEPINVRDMPGYFLQQQAQAHAVLDAVDSPQLKVLMVVPLPSDR